MRKKNNATQYVLPFSECGLKDVSLVGGKNASLGEMIKSLGGKGVNVPGGFAVTVNVYWDFIYENKLREPITSLLSELDRTSYSNLNDVGAKIRTLIEKAILPQHAQDEIAVAYGEMCEQYGDETDVAVRSSATAEDLPSASFAGQHDSFLNVTGTELLLLSVHRCFVSLFTDRAIKYREDNHFDHMKVGLSVGIQKMVRADLASAGVIFTLEPESGFRDIILITGAWGLGENVVQGTVTPDEYFVYKRALKAGMDPIVQKKPGSKNKMMIYAGNVDHQPGTLTSNIDTPTEKRSRFTLNDEEVKVLAHWAEIIEEHYKMPMDIEWAKDGETDRLYIVQARPETVHQRRNPYIQKEYILKDEGKVIVSGNAVSGKIVSGTARILHSTADRDKLQPGEILVTDITNPDWDPIMKKAGAIITDRGGRTSHAAIVARELGLAAVVGTIDGTKKIKDGQQITISCALGETCTVYEGALKWEEKEYDLRDIKMPKTAPMLIIGDPDNAFALSFLPSAGVGLMRMEFAINNSIRIHPMALVQYDQLSDEKVKSEIAAITSNYSDKKLYFIEQLARAVATVACAFYPREVIVRMSDFKTNEYANLIGGKEFEPHEENPMIGFRGASRYYHERYIEGFKLECRAMKMVREEMGLDNVKLMIPFCRTVEEGKKVVDLMASQGLIRGKNKLEIYVMAEIPSNVLLAEQFALHFDGFSIGSNDLTQLTLGIDRDNSVISSLFDEKNAAAKQLIATLIRKAKLSGVKVGLCGQAPSDFPDYAQFLVEEGIDSISFNPDALLKGIENMNQSEKKLANKKHKPAKPKPYERTRR